MFDAPAVVDDTEGLGLEGAVDEADKADKDVNMEGEEERRSLNVMKKNKPMATRKGI